MSRGFRDMGSVHRICTLIFRSTFRFDQANLPPPVGSKRGTHPTSRKRCEKWGTLIYSLAVTGESKIGTLKRKALNPMTHLPYWPLRAARELGQPISWPVQYLRAAPEGSQSRVAVDLKNLESCFEEQHAIPKR